MASYNLRTVLKMMGKNILNWVKSNCVNNLLSTATNLPLAAAQGKVLDEKIGQINQSLKLIQSHVGMIVQSTTLDTEAKVIAIYGGTKWTKIEGRFLLGASSSYKINTIGGEASHKLTVNEMPAHRHTTYCGGKPGFAVQPVSNGAQGWNAANANSSSTGGNAAHNNMPPYKVVYIWERTD